MVWSFHLLWLRYSVLAYLMKDSTIRNDNYFLRRYDQKLAYYRWAYLINQLKNIENVGIIHSTWRYLQQNTNSTLVWQCYVCLFIIILGWIVWEKELRIGAKYISCILITRFSIRKGLNLGIAALWDLNVDICSRGIWEMAMFFAQENYTNSHRPTNKTKNTWSILINTQCN